MMDDGLADVWTWLFQSRWTNHHRTASRGMMFGDRLVPELAPGFANACPHSPQRNQRSMFLGREVIH